MVALPQLRIWTIKVINGLLTDFAKLNKVTCIIRGLRGPTLGQEKDVVERSASNARRREVEIAGGRVFVMTYGARNVA